MLLSAIANGQGFYNTVNWKFSNPTQMGITFLDVDFFDDNNVIAVGASGGIAKSTDGGRNWKYGPFTYINAAGLPTSASLNDVHYITATIAYAVGDRGCMAKTADGGQNWSFVNTPLFAATRNINTCWFLNKDTGYIAGQFNTPDSVPKLYFTRNGGTTWDSIAAPPSNGKSRVGYINNPNIPSVLDDVTAKAKEIYRIEFLNDSIGYICGSASSLFPRASQSANATTCLPNGGNLTGSASNAALLWKFTKGVLTDYSLSKERLGYFGIVNNAPLTCTNSYNSAQFGPVGQTYRAMKILNDSSVIMMSFNNNCVMRVNTGKNDSTLNVNIAGVYEKGKYIILNQSNFPFGGPQTGPQIPPVQVLLASNPYHIRMASNGKLYAGAGFGRLWTSIDNGVNWREERCFPVGQNYSQASCLGFDISPNGKFLFTGTNGVVADSIPGGAFFSNYNLVAPGGGYSKIDFVDCNTGIASGGSSITRTLDGGKTWLDNNRPDFASSFYNINGLSYPRVNKAYFAVSNGTLYRSDNANASQAAFVLDPLYTDINYQMNDVAAVGNDTVYSLGYSAFSVPTANRKSTIFRSFNNGVSFQAVDIAVTTTTPAFTAPTLSKLAFPSRNIGYAVGSRNAVYKTIDAGATWTNISPFPALNFPGGTPFLAISYTNISAVNDNTIVIVGNAFNNITQRAENRVYLTTDGGVNWTNIVGNIQTLFPSGNMTAVLFHDANNGYVAIGATLFKTTNGGASWAIDISPTGILCQTMAFSPRTVPAGISFVNRRMFFAGFSGPGGSSNNIMEFGNPADISVNVSEVADGSCSTGATGSIVANTTGGIPPYSYSLNGGPFQSSNTFTGLTSGVKTLIVKDAFCSSITKSITVGVKQSPTVSAGPPKTIVNGDQVTLDGSTGNNIASSIAWTPAATLTGANTLTPTAKPTITTNYTLTVVNSNGCTSTSDALVTVLPYCIKVMDAFTPNGDNINDKWLVTQGGACTTQAKVSVFNRYGSEIYTNLNYQNDWTGTYKGKVVPDGTYYYQVEFTLVGGRKLYVKGDVTILR